MKKSFLKALLIVAVALLPAVGHAAGLGKLTVRSALGEPLLAEIDLVSVQKEDLVTLNARLASREAFTQARLEYLAVFASFKFSVELRGDVTPYIKVTSSQPVNDPFVDMLVELTWSSGKLLREYTFLLDPPGIAPPAPAVEAVPAPPVAAPTPAPVAPPPQAAAPAPAITAPAAAPGKKAPTEPRPSGEGWAVKRGDTLSKVAQAHRPQGVSLNQMLAALYRANPEAFSGKNMNRLKTGPILRIPDAKEIEAVPARDANLEVRAQVSEWNEYRQRLASAALPAAGAEAKPEAVGKVTTKVEEATPAAGEKKEVLKLSKGEPPAGAQDSRAAQARIQALQEDAIAKDKALKEANERVAQLEKNIKEMQKLLELKGVAAPGKPEAPKPADAPAAAEAPKAADAPKPAEAPKAEPAESAKPAEAPKPAAPKPPPPAQPKAPPPPPEPSFFEGPAALGGLLALLLGALGYMAYRRRKPAAPALAAAGASAAAVEPAMPEVEVKAVAGTGEEVDSLAEAEVYLAYGRDAQAEEILKEALARQPGRAEIHTKLLQIYSKRGDKPAFEQTARVLQSLGVTGAAWESVQSMGLALDPGNPLYGGAPAAAPAAPAVPEAGAALAPVPAREEPASIDFDLDAIVAATPAAQPAFPAARPAEAGELVFDITAPEPDETYQMVEKVDVALSGGGEPKSLDLSLPSIDLEIPGADAMTPSVVRDAHWQEVATKFDLAKVYKEMGDRDGAREILQEVIREGDAQQQEEAKALLASL